MELPSDLPDHYTLGDIIRERTDSEYPDYQPHLSDETYTFRKPTVFGEPETDVEDDDGYPDEQSHPDDDTDKKFRERNGRAYKMDSIGRWYEVDHRGEKIIRSRHDRRHVVGNYSVGEWSKLSTKRKEELYQEALDNREAQ